MLCPAGRKYVSLTLTLRLRIGLKETKLKIKGKYNIVTSNLVFWRASRCLVSCIYSHARWVSVSNSGLCCCIYVKSFERGLTRLCVDSARWRMKALSPFSKMVFCINFLLLRPPSTVPGVCDAHWRRGMEAAVSYKVIWGWRQKSIVEKKLNRNNLGPSRGGGDLGNGHRQPPCSVYINWSPFLIGGMFVREPSWKYSANLVGS